MTERHYCEVCNFNREIIIKERPATYNFRKEPFDIIEQYAECSICGEDVYHEEMATHTLQQLSQLYQSKHSFTPEDIKKIRKSTGLTQTLFAKVINMGEATIKRYEAGTSLPDGTQLGILKMLQKNPGVILEFYEENKKTFSPHDREIISEKLNALTSENLEKSTYEVLHLLYSKYENQLTNGYSKFQPAKLFNMILFFSKEGVLKTKLMKLLWYTDFLMYQKQEYSISGVPYWHKEFGPVPVEHDTVLGSGTALNIFSIHEEEDVNTGYTKMIVKSDVPFNDVYFTEEELSTMKFVEEFFASYGSKAISDYSHQEEAWKQTKEEEVIPYSFAKSIHLHKEL
ncbi:DUF4065 domain-containing protein [Sporosarcina sp. PTS2304]|uniref:type II TA system antitoxin MqsA family protein n=1 Tax=Sporosarcina sp. PTS2304 TaxID=2283194 RepID=UPI000E0D6BDF|nr:type II TA system antitoxin MqsA family protein [Sporosarcina sp. PTS2304]AXH99829.1 DUF4065 domain-containing protein [Sporosarcina sp. PTS2304]